MTSAHETEVACGESFTLYTDEWATIESSTLTLTDVSSTSVIVDVDGTTSSIITAGTSDEVDGLDIEVVSVDSHTAREDSSAELIVHCEEEADETEFVFEYDTSIDLSDVVPTLTSVQGIYVHSALDNTIVLNPYTASGDFLPEATDLIEVTEVWLYTPEDQGVLADGSTLGKQKWVAVFYKDTSDNKVKLFGHVNGAAAGNEYFELHPGDTAYSVKSKKAPIFVSETMLIMKVGDEITLSWGLASADSYFNSLGRTQSVEETNEVRIGTTGVGLEKDPQTSSDGITVQDPDDYGANDQVSLLVPREGGSASAAPGEELKPSLGDRFKQVWFKMFY